MLPQDTVVLFVEADDVWHGHGIALSVVTDDIEVVDLAEAVTPELERVCERPDPGLAYVERVATEIERSRITVWHDHLGKRGAVQQRPLAALVGVADRVQDQPLAGGEAHPEAPLLPANRVSLDLKAGAAGLPNLNWLQVSPGAGGGAGVIGILGRQGHHPEILDADHLHRMQVNHGHHILDRPGVAVVLRAGAHPGQRAHEPSAVVVFNAVVAVGPGIDHTQVKVRDAPLAHRRLPIGVRPAGTLALQELLDDDVRLSVRHMPPRGDPAAGQRDDRLVRSALRPVQQDDERFTLHRAS